MAPQPADILVSIRSATTDHEVSVVPADATLVFPNYIAAIAKARELAKKRHVDLWVTEDHTHFMKLRRTANLTRLGVTHEWALSERATGRVPG